MDGIQIWFFSVSSNVLESASGRRLYSCLINLMWRHNLQSLWWQLSTLHNSILPAPWDPSTQDQCSVESQIFLQPNTWWPEHTTGFENLICKDCDKHFYHKSLWRLNQTRSTIELDHLTDGQNPLYDNIDKDSNVGPQLQWWGWFVLKYLSCKVKYIFCLGLNFYLTFKYWSGLIWTIWQEASSLSSSQSAFWSHLISNHIMYCKR